MLVVGRIGKPHGLRGDLVVSFTTDRSERWQIGARITAKIGASETVLAIESVRPQSDRWVVHFVGYDTRNDAERLVNAELFAEPIDDPDSLWVHQLIGSVVADTAGRLLGTCIAVIDNPAHAILELDNGGLIPVTFIVSSTDGHTIVDPPEGLLE
ncbi:MAG: 16S rRNA processing protein RimM [Ilumatobacteraceae bacterium]|nr:16S rRNA processing protein RimM [Ilumatobacteraceae bacterium]